MAAVLSGSTKVDIDIQIPNGIVSGIRVRFPDQEILVDTSTLVPIREAGSSQSLHNCTVRCVSFSSNLTTKDQTIRLLLRENGGVIETKEISVAAQVTGFHKTKLFLLGEA